MAAALVIAAAASTSSGGPPALAQQARANTPQSADEAANKLQQERDALAAKETRSQELQKDMASIADERREINARLVETAALVQKSEEQMTAIETRLAGLDKQERDLRGSLAKEHAKISGILAALQRMGRNPPPVIITRREDALQMVRSAMLLGVAFPGLRKEAQELSGKLTELVGIMTSIRREGDNLRAERERLNTTQTRLASLLETKKQSLADRQVELKQVRDATAEISKNVTDLSELIAKLSQQVNTTPAAAPVEQPKEEVVAVLPPAATAAPIAGAEPVAVKASPVAVTPQRTEEVAMLTPSATPRETPPSIVELAPATTALGSGKPDRIAPAVPFQLAKGKLLMPARGRRALGFGEKTQYGGTSKGLVLETRYGARVTSPCDGWVVYAGEFRSYGQLLIINAGGGYHVLIAGLSQMDVGPGQFVLAAEPIGTMSGAPRTAQLASDRAGTGQSPPSGAPVLYIEFRKDGQPINSDPWWVASHEKVQE
ncbi:murein hydrolase activator EnvC family protein [Hyphomicrobium sp.]|uniref:murein hydrolase activator EnvC family protein n=1 Tax=Hyphomicrobium sp. TaxID=82 RepID=UPI002E3043BB|nr:peptidoglycan DD-metalloendopeptidase family protein [Hyphomicrobium sp.]HEX2840557.1 peptidoglycan DD-metalloendopeptidase family protein [Hyphomicrobium sp.]